MATSVERINNICLIIIASFITIAALYYTKIAMIPFVISLFFFAVLSPMISGVQEKLRVPRFLAIIICFFFIVLGTALTWLLLFESFKAFYMNIDFYKLQAIALVQETTTLIASFGFSIEPNFIQQEIQNLPLLAWLRDFTGGLASFVGNFFLIIVFTMFLLAGESKYQIPENSLINNLKLNISRYITMKFLTSLSTGLSVGILLLICDVELAFVFAFITFLLNFIPNIGSIIAATLPLPIIVLNSGFSAVFFIVLIGQIVIHSMIGTVLEPKILGGKMDLHPIAILMFLIFWGLVWGIPGMFLAVPITAILKIVLSKIESTQSFSELLAGRIHSDEAPTNSN